MINDEADEVIQRLFDSLENRYKNNLESIRGSELSSTVFIYCIVNFIKQIQIVLDDIGILLIG